MASFVPPGIAGLLDLLGSETWEDRLQEAAYTSPQKGTKIKFLYEDLERTTPLYGRLFTFPGVNNAYVQRNGFGSREYPMRCFISGPNHDKIATAFEAALLEHGTGKLQHPMYGKIPVVPFGSIHRNDAVKTAANQSVIEVTFFTTTGEIYPSSQPAGANEILGAIDGFDVAAAQQFDASMSLLSTINKVAAKATLRSYLMKVSSALQSVSDSVTSVNRQFRDLQASVNLGLDVLIGQPLLLARQVSDLIKAPARAIAGIESRLDAYAALADSVFGSSAADPATKFLSGSSLSQRLDQVSNDFHISDLMAANAVAGSMVSVTTPGAFSTRPQAMAAAALIQSQLDASVAWRDAGFAALGGSGAIGAAQLDTGAAYQALQEAGAITVGFLVQTSFGLVAERRITLDRDRTIIDLAAELYGSVDDRLDLLINSNNLTGDEILELPAGRTIAYYPDA
jgi:prophage DNA circulation protein